MKLALSATIPAAAAFLAPVTILADTAEADAPAEEMTIDWIQEIINGGMTSAVLLLLSAAAVGFLVERLIRMRKKYLAPAYYADFFADAIAKNDVAAIRKEAETKPSILADAGASYSFAEASDSWRTVWKSMPPVRPAREDGITGFTFPANCPKYRVVANGTSSTSDSRRKMFFGPDFPSNCFRKMISTASNWTEIISTWTAILWFTIIRASPW